MDKDLCQIRIDMIELWDVHVALTREVIFAATFNTPNLSSSLTALLQNQKDLGNNLALYYGKKAGDRYAELLTVHINVAVEIVVAILTGKDAQELIKQWYANGDDIAKFLTKLICPVEYGKIDKLFRGHLDCTLEEAGLIIGGKYAESTVEYQVCLDRTRRIANYLAVKIYADQGCCDK